MPRINENKFFEIKNLSENTVEIRIYGTITKWADKEYGQVSSASFAKELENYKNVSQINLRINSPGGDVFEASTIYNLLKDFAKVNNIQITGYIDGLAASAASFLVLCASKVVMGIGALFMIHNPLTYAYGNTAELQKQIQLLDTVKESILDIYCTKSKLNREEIAEKMNNEKWFRANEALEAGFVDEIVENDNSLENIKNISNELHIENYIHQDLLKEKLKEIENMKNAGGRNMPKSIQELVNEYPQLMNDFKNQIINEVKGSEKEKIENAVLEERKRIEALDKIPVINDKQREVINKAKYEEPRDSKDIVVDFYMSNANKAQEEIEKIKNEQKKSGIDGIAPSTEEGQDDVFNEICAAAIQAFNKK
nr:MAG TPA: putative ATP dependent Clp protease [Caudovirales sp. ctnYA4]